MTVTVRRKVIVNGKEYHSLDELPPDLRALYDKAMASGPDRTNVQRFVINGHNFEHLDIPDDVRQVIAGAMGDSKQTASPILIIVVVIATLILIGLALLQLFY